MKKLKKGIFGVIIVCLLAVGLYIFTGDKLIPKVDAAESKKKEPDLNDATGNMCEDDDFELDVSLMQGTNSYKVALMSGKNSSGEELNQQATFKPAVNPETKADESVFKYIGYNVNTNRYKVSSQGHDWAKIRFYNNNGKETTNTEGGNVIDKKHYAVVELDSRYLSDKDDRMVVIRFQLESVSGGCSLKGKNNDNQNLHTESLYKEIGLPMINVGSLERDVTNIKKDNPSYNTYCKLIREPSNVTLEEVKNWYTGSGVAEKLYEIMQKSLSNPDSQSIFKALVPFCWETSITPRTRTQIKQAVKQAITSYHKDGDTFGASHNEEFLKAFNESKFRAGGKVSENGDTSELGCATSLAEGQQKGHCFKTSSKTNLSDTQKLKCDANYFQPNIKPEDDYDFSNLQSYYAYSDDEKIKVTYKYNKTGAEWNDHLGKIDSDDEEALERTTPNSNSKVNYSETKTVCTRVCEEAVDVEYGPPVASKGGLCFEYRVKVTSRVKCEAKLNSNKDTLPTDVRNQVCTPAPYCIHKGSSLTRGAGPNEDFNACINECDGGKYTQSCSKKCYEKVYNNPEKLAVSYSNMQATKLSNSQANPERFNELIFTPALGPGRDQSEYDILWNLEADTPAHYYVLGEEILYTGGYARWYYEKSREYTQTHHGHINIPKESEYAYYKNEGIRRVVHDANSPGTSICTADCHYASCGSGYYNDQDAEYDYLMNMQAYNDALDKCKAAASCNTTTTEFEMSTDYNDTTVKFPSKGTDKVTSKESGDDPSKVPTLKACKDETTGDSCAKDSVLYDYNGCYRTPNNPDKKKYGDGDKFYQSEITYPGTWIKNKTQEISYDPHNEEGWYKENEKFCLPLGVKDVNAKWWLWYMNRVALSKNYYFEEDYQTQCSIIDKSITEETPAPEDGLKYNIHAKVKDFGHYKWDFNVDCFYASYESIKAVGEGGDEANDKCDPNVLNYRVRPVDPEDLFPSEDGTAITSPSDTGREPGYNWTKSATISAEKAKTASGTSNYYVNPETLITAIQSRGDTIFDESKEETYLDYSFYLTPEMLNKLSSYNANKKYTDYNGEFYSSDAQIKKNGFIAYKSNLFNFSGKASVQDGYNLLGNVGGKYVKAVGNIGCNNDAAGSACETTANMK